MDEISEAVFSEWSPMKRKAMGLAMAIFFDPTTYTPAGTLTVPLSRREASFKSMFW